MSSNEDEEQKRREMGRVYQRRYIERQQQHTKELEEALRILREKINTSETRNEKMRRSCFVNDPIRTQTRQNILHSYGKIYEGQIPSQTPEFLWKHFSPALLLQTTNYPLGPQTLQRQWTRYSTLFPSHQARIKSIQVLDHYCDVFRITFDCRKVIPRSTLHCFCENRLQPFEDEIAKQLANHSMQYQMIQTVHFGANGKVKWMSIQIDDIASWQKCIPAFCTELSSQSRSFESLAIVRDDRLESMLHSNATKSEK